MENLFSVIILMRGEPPTRPLRPPSQRIQRTRFDVVNRLVALGQRGQMNW